MLGLVERKDEPWYIDNSPDDDVVKIPDRIDWRNTKGILTEIKNQGKCGSCWAFTTAAVVEGRYAYKNPNWKIQNLSPQELVDCG